MTRPTRPVAALLALVSALALPCASAQPYECVFASGYAVKTKYPCDPALLERFGARLAQLYPDFRQDLTSPDFAKNAYVIAISACDERWIRMTPEQLGKNSEPFMPWRETAALAQAARETVCPPRQ